MMTASENNQTRPAISAVLPAYNEAANLAACVAELARALERYASAHEIVIVNDGSGDDTGVIADRLAGEISGVRAVHHAVNRGYGAALRSGFAACRYEWLFFSDSDGQFVMDEIGLLTALVGEGEFISGYRAQRADPWRRRLYGRMFSGMVRALFGVRARDVNCAFKLFKKELIADARLTSEGALINAELLCAARSRGVDPVEVAVSHRPRGSGEQTGGSVRVIVRALGEIIALSRRSGRCAPARPPSPAVKDSPDEGTGRP